MKSFCLVWSSLLDSSLWVGATKEARIVWITLLALKDKDGIVHNTELGLAHRAIVSIDECRAALKFLSSPDPDSSNKDCQGRRIVPIEGGWQIVSHDKYRFSTEAARAYWRESKAKSRKRKTDKDVSSKYRADEKRFVDAENEGNQTLADKIAAGEA